MSSTDSILKGKYPGKSHAQRVGQYLQNAGFPKEGIIYLESQKTRLIEDNDEPVPFRYVRRRLSRKRVIEEDQAAAARLHLNH